MTLTGVEFDGNTNVKIGPDVFRFVDPAEIDPNNNQVWHHFTAAEIRKADAGLPHVATCGKVFKGELAPTGSVGRSLTPMQKCVICQELKDAPRK